jgi:HK97 family phage portal protein
MANKQLNLWQRMKQLPAAMKSAMEGSYRPAWGQGELGGWFQLDPLDGTGFQRSLTVTERDAERFGPVYACVAILSQETARIMLKHYRVHPDGRRELVMNKAPARIFRKPNHYQTRSDFLLYMMRSLLLDGNAYAICTRNDRNEVDALYPVMPGNMFPYISRGTIVYRHGDEVMRELSDEVLEHDQWYPQRDVLHIRMHCPKHPLVGESPLTAALNPTASGMMINAHNASFFANMSRPSGILRHPGSLSDDAMSRIKQRFMDLTQRHHSGEPIVLQENMDWKPLTMSAVDAELISSFKLSERQVAQVFRVPPFLLGDLEKSSLNNVESLSGFFVNSALGFYLNHIETALTAFFRLPPDEHIDFDVETALLRGDLESRMAAYAKAAQSGVMSPDEIRLRENLPPAPDGHGKEPRVQQQLVPLSYGSALQPPASNPPPADEPPADEPTEEEALAASLIAQKAIEKAMES